MVSQSELKKRRVKAAKQQIRQEVVVERRDRRKRLGVSLVIGFLSLALIAPLAAGLFLSGDDEATSEAEIPELPLDSTPPALVDPGFEGQTLTGDTPCPATDGTQERVTTFETAPAGCLTAGATYGVELDTLAGDITIELDAAGAPEATDLFVSLARYGVYEGAPIVTFAEGLTTIGGFGDAGFTVTASEPPADGVYPVGSVVLLATVVEADIRGQFAVITDEASAEVLAADANSPIIGTVTDGLEVFAELGELSLANPDITYRLRTATVTETAG